MSASFRALSVVSGSFACIVALGSVLALPNDAAPAAKTAAEAAAEQPAGAAPANPGRLRAVDTHVEGGGGLDACPNDTERLAILEGERELFQHLYCSEHGWGGGRLVTDALGRHYVLLEYGEGRGNRNTSMNLSVYRFLESLDERANLVVRTPVGLEADVILDYRVETPASGGLVLRGTRRLDGELAPGDPPIAPEATTVLEIDTVPAADS